MSHHIQCRYFFHYSALWYCREHLHRFCMTRVAVLAYRYLILVLVNTRSIECLPVNCGCVYFRAISCGFVWLHEDPQTSYLNSTRLMQGERPPNRSIWEDRISTIGQRREIPIAHRFQVVWSLTENWNWERVKVQEKGVDVKKWPFLSVSFRTHVHTPAFFSYACRQSWTARCCI